ncbi:restriction endonuclease subunit S [Glutamicibacter sp. ZJUTW]|uniref:restriction endonuclease subunit S n=1 Tax=Glutamicibacter sp. ZJUTW TaxID=1155384 RepID=UPI0011F24796|nr:restriction endonuclease subunit S [Glutamicibacter sp. ZJUTW]QEP06364.1 hypothetical protein F0M17_03445 [Glutamicibacter sp. ZJUTW]
MSRIDELIAEHCPEGVDFRPLAEITSKSTGIKWASVADASFKYIDLSSVDRVTRRIGETVSVTAADAPSRARQVVRTGDVIFATTRPTQMRWAVIPEEYDEQIASTGYCVLRPNNDVILTNFLAHILGTGNFSRYVESNQVEGNYPSIPDSRIREFKVPVPPLEVQREIVRILDTFSKMEAELEAELDARKQQYDYYLRKLTDPSEIDGRIKVGWKASQIGQLCRLEKGRTPIQKAIPGQYPLVVTASARRSSSEYQFDTAASCVPLVSSKGHGVASISKVYFQEGKFALGNILCAIIPNDFRELSAEFITYFLQSRKDFLLVPLMRGGANVSLTVDSLRKLTICFPPRDEQDRIVSALKAMEALIDDQAYSLPTELSARRQQYEYYRDKLLSFKELEPSL